MRHLALSIALIFSSFLLSAQLKHGLRDENGRHVIGRGFVIDKITQESAVK